MRVTKFMVDKAQPVGTMKVGNQWKKGYDREAKTLFPERRVDEYSWSHDTEPKANLPYPPMAFDVVQLKDVETLLLGFEITKMAMGEVQGTFGIGVTTADGLATVTTQPNPASAVTGLVTIDVTKLDDQHMGTFELTYTIGDVTKKLYSITVKPDKDFVGWAIGSPMVGGPYVRKGGKWVNA